MKKVARLSKDKIRKALKATAGNVTAAADQLGCTRRSVYNWLDRYPELKEAVAEERERLVDLAESALKKKISEGDTASIIFTLKTLGKKRGYIEKQQVEQSGSLDVTYKVDAPKILEDTDD